MHWEMGIIIVFLTVTLYSVVKRTVKKKRQYNKGREKVKPKTFLAKFIFYFDDEIVFKILWWCCRVSLWTCTFLSRSMFKISSYGRTPFHIWLFLNFLLISVNEFNPLIIYDVTNEVILRWRLWSWFWYVDKSTQCFPTFFCSRHPYLVFKVFGGTPVLV